VAELVEQAAIGDRLFERVEVGALQVLDEGRFERFAIGEVADEGRDLVQLG
jgi:hypothetical protein